MRRVVRELNLIPMSHINLLYCAKSLEGDIINNFQAKYLEE